MKQGFFVTGTDTGVGKTTVSSLLLQAYVAKGYQAVGMKPVASGCDMLNGHLVSDDAARLRDAGNVQASMALINPYVFEPPLAPHIAAKLAGIEIRLPVILDAYHSLRNQADVVIVEGVGGFLVPLNESLDTTDLAVELDLPVILVVGMRLGCINHALLTAEAVASRGLSLCGWVASCVDPGMMSPDANIAALEAKLPCPRILTVPFLEQPMNPSLISLDALSTMNP